MLDIKWPLCLWGVALGDRKWQRVDMMTDHEAPPEAVFSSPLLLLRHNSSYTPLSTLFSNTLTPFPWSNRQTDISVCICKFPDTKLADSGPNDSLHFLSSVCCWFGFSALATSICHGFAPNNFQTICYLLRVVVLPCIVLHTGFRSEICGMETIGE